MPPDDDASTNTDPAAPPAGSDDQPEGAAAEAGSSGESAEGRTSPVPPVLRALVREERAAFAEARVELRHEAGKPAQIDGHALVYNKWSEDLGGFRERILPGAASDSIQAGADVRGLFNHDPNYILGRSTAGTLTLEDQPRGLRYLIDPPETPTIRDLVLGPMGRNELNQSSFQFIATADEWREPPKSGGLWERDLIAFDLLDVSPVTFPAYPQTDVGLRSRIARELGISPEVLSSLIARAVRGSAASDGDESLIRDAAEVAAAAAAGPSAVRHADPEWNRRMKGSLR